MRNNSATPTWRMKALLACLSTLCTYAVIEAAYRYEVSKKIAAGKYPITVISEDMSGARSRGLYTPNRTIRYRMFDADHALLKENRVVTNNFGFISGNDYRVEKPEGEFRIVAVGDSLTACETNDFPWTDVLERHLNADEALKKALRVTSFRVLNLGLSGSGFPCMTHNFVRYGEQFSPDLLVVNYIEDDFVREPDINANDHIKSAENFRRQDMQGKAAKVASSHTIQIGEAEIIVHGGRRGQHADIRDPTITPSRLFIIPDDKVALDKERVGAIKAEIAATLLRYRLWCTPYPFALARLFGREFTLEYNRYLESIRNPSNDASVTQAASFIAALHKRHPKVLCIQNPLQWELVPFKEPTLTRLLREKLPEATIVEMAEYLPTEKGDAEITSWYNLPFDGHWSNKGAEVYAAAIHRAFQRLLPSYMENSSEKPPRSQTLSAKSGTTR